MPFCNLFFPGRLILHQHKTFEVLQLIFAIPGAGFAVFYLSLSIYPSGSQGLAGHGGIRSWINSLGSNWSSEWFLQAWLPKVPSADTEQHRAVFADQQRSGHFKQQGIGKCSVENNSLAGHYSLQSGFSMGRTGSLQAHWGNEVPMHHSGRTGFLQVHLAVFLLLWEEKIEPSCQRYWKLGIFFPKVISIN